MNFKKNFDTNPFNNRSLLAFFHEKNKEDLNQLASDLTPEAKDFFEASVSTLLGQMPDAIAETVITMNRSSLHHLLYSSMVTGYLSKAVETKLELEKVWEEAEENSGILKDKHLSSKPRFSADDIDSIM